MPSITCDKVVLDELYGKIAESVVTIKRSNQSGIINFGTGFIIHSTRSVVLVCTDHSVLKAGEVTHVHYNDGTSCQAFEFIRRTRCGHAILSVPVQTGERRRSPVSFSEAQVKREEICTIARVEHNGEPGVMPGIVVAPNGTTMMHTGALVPRYKDKFALTCSHGKNGDEEAEETLLGAPIFTLSGLFVGSIYSDSGCYGLKFARHSSFFKDELQHMIHNELKKVSLSRGAPPLSKGSKVVHPGSKDKRSPEDETNIALGKRQKMENWCGGSPW